MHLTDEELLAYCKELEIVTTKFHNMMIADEWVITGDGAESPDGTKFSFTHNEHIDRYVSWKLQQLGWQIMTVHVLVPAYYPEHQYKCRAMYRSPTNRIYNFLDAKEIVYNGTEVDFIPAPISQRFTTLFQDDINEVYVEFRLGNDNLNDYFRSTKERHEATCPKD